MTLRYAAYGSNLHPARLQLRTPSARLLGTSLHNNYSMRFHKRSVDGSGKCGLFRGSTGVHFAVYEMSVDDKLALDDIEGTGSGYEQIEIELDGFGECFTYSPSLSHVDSDLVPYDWYRELVVLGCREHGFPQDYVNSISRTGAVTDPDEQRAALNWRLAESLADPA